MGLRYAIIKWQWKTKQVSAGHGGAIMEMQGPCMKNRILLPVPMATNLLVDQILCRRYAALGLLHFICFHTCDLNVKQTNKQTGNYWSLSFTSSR